MAGDTTGGTMRRRAAFFGVALAVAAGFGWSVVARAPEWGRLHPNLAGWHTAGSVVFAEHWRAEGAARLAFAMVWAPASVDQPTLESRRPYTSFGPGAVVPLHLIALLLRQPPTPALAWGLSLAVQGLVAGILAALAWGIARRAGFGALGATPPALAAGLAYVGMPAPYYEHMAAYFADQAVMLPFALFLLVELARRSNLRPALRFACDVAQALLVAWGLATEWLFAFVALTAMLLRLADGTVRLRAPGTYARLWPVVAPVILVGLLFLGQLWLLDALADTGGRFALRSGARSDGSFLRAFLRLDFGDRFWTAHLRHGLGPGAAALVGTAAVGAITAGLASLMRRRNGGDAAGLADLGAILALALLPCLLYYAVFREHNNQIFHPFVALKFALPAALALCGLLPATLARALGFPRMAVALAWLFAAVALGYLAALGGPRARSFDLVREIPVTHAERIGPHLRAHAGYNDILFATDFEVEEGNPIGLLHSRKPVHRAASLARIREHLAEVEGDYTLWLLVDHARTSPLPDGLDQIVAAAGSVSNEGGFRIHRIARATLEALPDGNRRD